MKEKLISLLIECDIHNGAILSDKSMSPSSSIEEIATFFEEKLKTTKG